MKKLLLILASLLLSVNLMAKAVGSTQVSVSGSYLLSYFYDLSYNDAGDPEKKIGSGYNIDLTAKYFFTSNLAFNFGFGYQSQDTVLKDNNMMSSGTVEATYTYQYYQLHVGADYYFTDIVYAGAGLIYGLAGDVKTEMQGVKNTLKDGKDGWTIPNKFAVYLELGLDYPITDKIGFLVAVNMEKSFTNASEKESSDYYIRKELKLYSYAIKLGVNYSF